MFDLIPHLTAVAQRSVPPGSTELGAALALGGGLRALTLEPQTLSLPGLQWVASTGDLEADTELECDVTVIVHRGDTAQTVQEVESRMQYGQRITLVDAHLAGQGDPALLDGLLASTVYLGSLASYDTDLTRALLVPMVPLRDGLSLRRYLAQTQLHGWAWRGVVRAELLRRFGESIPPARLPSAVTHARSRLGAYLVKLARRGLRFEIERLWFDDGRVDGIGWTLRAR